MTRTVSRRLHRAPAKQYLPAAAIPEGAVVGVDDTEIFEILRVHSSMPHAGRITWETLGGNVVVGGADRIEVIRLP